MNTDKYVGLSDLAKYHSRLMDNFSDVEMKDILKLFFEDRSELFTISSDYTVFKNEVDQESVSGYLMLPIEIDGETCESFRNNLLDNTKVTGLFVPGNYGGFYISRYAPVETVYIESSSISSNGFQKNDNIKEIYLMDSVTSLGQSACKECYGLEKIRLSDYISTIPSQAFQSCHYLKEVHFPKGLRTIETDAFAYCNSLEHVELPESLRTIGTGAFRGLGAKEIVIPDRVTGDLNISFQDSELESVIIGDSVKSLTGTFSYHDGSLDPEGTGPLQNVVIGPSVESINSHTFANASLTSITIPENVISISPMAFDGCIYLTDIEVDEDNPNYSAENGVLYNKDKSLMVAWPAASGSITVSLPFEKGCFGVMNGGNKGITSVTLSGITDIPEEAFYGCSNLESVDLPEGMTIIPSGAFENCTSLSGIELPSTITALKNMAFYGCTGLTEITFPDGIESIGQYTFNNCTGLTSITIPDSCTNLGVTPTMAGYAFGNCTSLTTVHIGSGITDFNAGNFNNCTSLSSVYIHNETPPRLRGTSPFSTVQNIYVPASAVETYKANTYWSSLASKIQAITE